MRSAAWLDSALGAFEPSLLAAKCAAAPELRELCVDVRSSHGGGGVFGDDDPSLSVRLRSLLSLFGADGCDAHWLRLAAQRELYLAQAPLLCERRTARRRRRRCCSSHRRRRRARATPLAALLPSAPLELAPPFVARGFNSCGGARVNLWLSPAATRSAPHFDDEPNVLSVARGAKRIWLCRHADGARLFEALPPWDSSPNHVARSDPFGSLPPGDALTLRAGDAFLIIPRTASPLQRRKKVFATRHVPERARDTSRRVLFASRRLFIPAGVSPLAPRVQFLSRDARESRAERRTRAALSPTPMLDMSNTHRYHAVESTAGTVAVNCWWRERVATRDPLRAKRAASDSFAARVAAIRATRCEVARGAASVFGNASPLSLSLVSRARRSRIEARSREPKHAQVARRLRCAKALFGSSRRRRRLNREMSVPDGRDALLVWLGDAARGRALLPAMRRLARRDTATWRRKLRNAPPKVCAALSLLWRRHERRCDRLLDHFKDDDRLDVLKHLRAGRDAFSKACFDSLETRRATQ